MILSSSELDWLFAAHLATCLMATGLIWTIQLVHYPSFLYVDKSQFEEFEKFHSSRISYVVIPIMIVEITSAVGLYVLQRDLFYLLNLLGNMGIWASTFLLSVPCHIKLGKGYDAKVIKRLVATNWPRTVLWTARSIALVYLATS